MAREIQKCRVIIDFTRVIQRDEDGNVVSVKRENHAFAVNPEIIETDEAVAATFEGAPRQFMFDLSSLKGKVPDSFTIGQAWAKIKALCKEQASTVDGGISEV